MLLCWVVLLRLSLLLLLFMSRLSCLLFVLSMPNGRFIVWSSAKASSCLSPACLTPIMNTVRASVAFMAL